MTRYYLDASVWLDLFEDRNEPNFPKSDWVQALLVKIVKNNDLLVYSDMVLKELEGLGYSQSDFSLLFEQWKKILLFVETPIFILRRGKDLSAKRSVPLLDALHALLAREAHACLVSFDHHFRKLQDIALVKNPKELI